LFFAPEAEPTAFVIKLAPAMEIEALSDAVALLATGY
jgi:hypothetical protein